MGARPKGEIDPSDPLRNFAPAEAKALEALLEGKSLAEAAKAAGKSARTIDYWVKRADFQAVMDATKGAIVRRARVKLALMVDRAIDVIDEGLDLEARTVVNSESKEKRRENPLGLRRLFALDVLDRVGIAVPKGVDVAGETFDELTLEAALAARGYRKLREMTVDDLQAEVKRRKDEAADD